MRYLERVFPWLLLAPAVLPLVYVDGLLYPYVAPKTLLFRALFVVAAAAFAYLALSGHPLYWKRLSFSPTISTKDGPWYFSLFAWIPAWLLLVAYATSLIGIDFYHSFWSIFDRGDGLLTLTSAVGFFYLTLLYADKEFLRRLLFVAACVGSVIAVYTIFQWLQSVFGMDFPFITEARGRIGATLGNAAFLAAYLGLTFFATLASVEDYKGRWRQVLYIGAGLQLVAITLTATRGTMLALLLAGGVTILYLALNGDERSVRTYARNGFLAAIVLAGLFFMFRVPLSESSFEPVRRIASISLKDVTVSSRLFVWQNILEEAVKKPFTGYGAEHIDVLFNRVYDPSAILEQWFDRSHNSYLDYFVQYGVFGLLLYGALLAAFVWTGWKLRRGSIYGTGRNDAGTSRYGSFIVLMALVYAVQNFFVFDTAMTLWFLLAVFAAVLVTASSIGAAGNAEKSIYGPSRESGILPRYAALFVGAVVLALLYPVALQPLQANLALAQGYLYHVVDVDRAIAQMQKGLSLGTYADLEYGYQAYSMYTDQQQIMLEGQERSSAYRYALETLTKNYERYPYDARTAVYLAHVLDSAPPEETVDEEFLRAVLARAIELSPKRIQPWYLLANISLKKGDRATGAVRDQHYRDAIQILAEYAEKVPEYAEPRYIIAGLYFVMGERAEAAHWAAEGLALYTKPHADTARHAVKYYIGIEDWENALRFLQDIVDEHSDDYEQIYDLAKLYFLTGDREHALEIYERLKREAPEVVETDPAFVHAIEQ